MMGRIGTLQGKKDMTEYNVNPDFKSYVDAYCTKHGITPEVAVQHALVRYVEEEYRDMRINRKGREYGD